MERRQAIKIVLAATASTMLFTKCAESNVIDFLEDGQLSLNAKHKDYLGMISESILPIKIVSDKIESAPDFILRMVNDCRSSDDITKFALGFDQYKNLIREAQGSISIEDADQAIGLMKEKIAATEPEAELVYFINEVKDLSIQNLKTSAFYLTQKTDYQLIPEAYQACTDV